MISKNVLSLSILSFFPIFVFTTKDVVSDSLRAEHLRILGGQNATEKQLPYQALLKILIWDMYMPCGGAIIDNRHILTAAHCIKNTMYDRLEIEAGFIDISDKNNPNRIKRAIEQPYLHSGYNKATHSDDIAILRMSENIPFSDYIQPIKIRTEPLKEGNCITSGWGQTTQNITGAWNVISIEDLLSKILQVVDLPLVNFEKCRNIYANEYGKHLLPGMLCAGHAEGKKDTCNGDSGGPLMCAGELTGVTSWGMGCGAINTPGIYTDVTFYKEWIESTLKQSYKDAGLSHPK